jgi:FkbM family methyltransferase
MAHVCRAPVKPTAAAAQAIIVDAADTMPVTLPTARTHTDMAAYCAPGTYMNHTGWVSTGLDFCIANPVVDRAVSRFISQNTFWEMDLMKRYDAWLEENAKEPGIMLDIGANMGQYGIVAALRGHRVFAWEAMVPTALLLRKTLVATGLDSKMTVFNNAISDFRGEIDIGMEETNTGGAMLDPTGTAHAQVKSTVNAATLDDFVAVVKNRAPGLPVHVIKMDIEGQELHAFANASRFWKALRPKLMLIEIDPARYRDCNLADFIWFLIQDGWQIELEKVFWITHQCTGPQFAPTRSKADVERWLTTVFKVGQYDMWAELISD